MKVRHPKRICAPGLESPTGAPLTIPDGFMRCVSISLGDGICASHMGAKEAVVKLENDRLVRGLFWFRRYSGFCKNHVEGVLAITEFDVIFFVWSGVDYLPSRTIRSKEIQDVVVEARGKRNFVPSRNIQIRKVLL